MRCQGIVLRQKGRGILQEAASKSHIAPSHAFHTPHLGVWKVSVPMMNR